MPLNMSQFKNDLNDIVARANRLHALGFILENDSSALDVEVQKRLFRSMSKVSGAFEIVEAEVVSNILGDTAM